MAGLREGLALVCIGSAGLKWTEDILLSPPEELRRRFSGAYLLEETEKLRAERQWLLSEEMRRFPDGFSEAYGIAGCRAAGRRGVLGALWDFLSEDGLDPESGIRRNAGAGCRFRCGGIPVRQFTVELCELVRQNPYRMDAAGIWIAAVERGDALVQELRGAGGTAAVFGEVTRGPARIRTDGEEEAFLTPD